MTALAAIGHNNPPADSPFEAIKVHIDDLVTEARNWADGQPVESEAQATEVSRLMEQLREAAKAADEARIAENKPFDDGKAEVQARYNPLIADTKTVKGKVPLAIDALKKALAPWLLKLDAEKRAREEEARKVAEAKAEAARKAIAEVRGSDLQSREDAEALVIEARKAELAAHAAANDKAQAKGGARATGLRSYFRAELTDRMAALKHFCITKPERMTEFLRELAAEDVREGKRQIPGFDVIEEKRVV